MAEEQVGVVVKFFVKPSVAAIEVTGAGIKIGDLLKYQGHTTDFTEEVLKSLKVKTISQSHSGKGSALKAGSTILQYKNFPMGAKPLKSQTN